MKVYIINSITKSYILNIKIRPLVTEYALMIKLVDGTSSAHLFNPYAYFGHSWSYFDIQNLPSVILYIFTSSSQCWMILHMFVCLNDLSMMHFVCSCFHVKMSRNLFFALQYSFCINYWRFNHFNSITIKSTFKRQKWLVNEIWSRIFHLLYGNCTLHK